MAESQPAGAPALNTNIESGDFNEKSAPPPAAKPKVEEEEEEDEDIDALIEDLESQDGHGFEEEAMAPLPAPAALFPRRCFRLIPVLV